MGWDGTGQDGNGRVGPGQDDRTEQLQHAIMYCNS